MHRENEQRGQLGGETLGRRDPDLGPGMGVEGAIGTRAEWRCRRTLQTARILAPPARAALTAARVSAVSPDWLTAITRSVGPNTGFR